MTLANAAQLQQEGPVTSNSVVFEERRRCYWSIILLRRLLGWPVEASNHKTPLPPFPDSPSSPQADAMSPEGNRVAADPSFRDGIVSTVIVLSKAWSLAQDYVRSRGTSERNIPPWSPESTYGTSMQMLLSLGKEFSPLHRYRHLRLSSVTSEELEKSRAYWAPWFLSRFLYHTLLCLINHPLLITLQFQGSEHVSELFLQQTAYLASHHTAWILHFIEYIETKRFYVTDPLIGYCAAVIATIELQQSFTEDRDHHEKRRGNYERCLSFIQRLGKDWQYNQRLVSSSTNCCLYYDRTSI